MRIAAALIIDPPMRGKRLVNTLNTRRTLAARLTGVAFAVVAQVSYAASNIAGETQVAGLTKTMQSTVTMAAAEPRRVGREVPLTLYVEDASGNAFRLVHVHGTGWKYIEGWKSPGHGFDSIFHKTAFGSETSAPAATAALSDNEPPTVFIDGPSGFTYVWNRDGGWKFVGKIVDSRP